MVQAIINLSEEEDRFINIYKAEKGIKSKSEAFKELISDFKNMRKDIELEEELDKIVEDHYKKYPNRRMTEKELTGLLGL